MTTAWNAPPPPISPPCTTIVRFQLGLVHTDAILTASGRQLVGSWNHFDYGKDKPAEDFVYRYDLDEISSLERTQLLSGKEAEAMKQRLCNFQGTGAVARGQDSALCQGTVHVRPERRPTTTPPANNQGRSVPPGSHR